MDKKLIGERLRRLRGDTDKLELANKVGVSERAIDSYELGERIPRDEVKKKIAEFYGVTVESIFFET